jgi:predicted RecA/RadA family phage recombinase
MRTSIKAGTTKTITAAAAITAGQIVLVGDIIGIALSAAAIGARVELETIQGNVYSYTKATGEAWTDGAKLYFDAANNRLTTTASGNTLVGNADGAFASGATTGNFRTRAHAG